MALPYLTHGFVGIGGTLKQRPSDFVVHEVPRYEPSGEGEHILFEIEKTGISTFEAIDHLARRLKVARREIGYAGLKDTRAVTRQWISVRGSTIDAVSDAATDRLRILFADRHWNKLRLGHLAGNRFVIRIRDVDPMKVVTLTPAIRTLSTVGMPNYFGTQRFGRRDRNDDLGLAFARNEPKNLLSILLGQPHPTDDDVEKQARQACDERDLPRALKLWPRHGRDEQLALSRLIKGEDADRVVAGIDRRLKSLWLSAAQSRWFNAVVGARIEALGTLAMGDLAYKHANGATFRVESVSDEQPRADQFEISPTGPLLGVEMQVPGHAARNLEANALVAAGLPEDAAAFLYGENEQPLPDWLNQLPPGARRPIRVLPKNLTAAAGIDGHGPYIETTFTLPAGSYATVLVREFMRNDSAALSSE